MPFPFDATLKDIAEHHTPDFEAALDLTDLPPARVLNVDLSTVSAATDIALGHGDPLVAITDLNFQAGPDGELPDRLLLYNALFRHRYHVPVHTLLLLLRPAADHATLTGKVRYQGRKRRGKLDFSFEIVRLWQQPVRKFLQGGLGTLPLAPLCRLPGDARVEDALPAILRRIDERLRAEATPPEARKLLAATYVLTGLRMPAELAAPIFQGLQIMRESSTYQLILDEGRIDELQKTVLRQGRIRFGAADETTQNAVNSISDGDRLRRMTERLLTASTWAEVLATA
ncbi:MAG: hypothetical protein HYS12_23110 [Planctomycetes bacterium]|nr:hypothetical protein [Planctomycetota bacterium]